MIGIWKLLLITIAIFVIFGAGKLPKVMGDLGVGIRKLKEGLQDDSAQVKDITPSNKE